MTLPICEQSAMNAIDFALDHIEDTFERTDFLQCWREGDVSEWPEYASWLHTTRGENTPGSEEMK